eukprot:g786.t1
MSQKKTPSTNRRMSTIANPSTYSKESLKELDDALGDMLDDDDEDLDTFEDCVDDDVSRADISRVGTYEETREPVIEKADSVAGDDSSIVDRDKDDKSADEKDEMNESPTRLSSLRRRRGAVNLRHASAEDLHHIVGVKDHDHECDNEDAVRPRNASDNRSEKRKLGRKKSSWLGFKSVIEDSDRRKLYKQRLKREFESDCFMAEITDQTICAVPKEERDKSVMQDSLHAIYVLGPSAAGKSYGLRSNLGRMLSLAKWDSHLVFHPIDGGVMRERSKMWGEMKSLRLGARSDCGEFVADGIGNLYKKYFKPHIGKCKERMFDVLIKKKRNIIIPDTATSFPDKTLPKIKKLHNAGYEIMFCAIVASKGKCEHNGSSRQLSEGKKYNSRGWSRAMDRVQEIVNRCRKKGIGTDLPCVIINNDDWSNVTCEILKPLHLMTWTDRVTSEWRRSNAKTYVEASKARRSNGAATKPLFQSRKMRTTPSSSPKARSDKKTRRKSSLLGKFMPWSWGERVSEETGKKAASEVTIDDLLDAARDLEIKRATHGDDDAKSSHKANGCASSAAPPPATPPPISAAAVAGRSSDDDETENDPSLKLSI